MGSISDFLNNMDWWGLLTLLISAAAALLCITLHELSHGFVAWRLGDPTAKNAGRLTLNPIRHLDVVGLLMMLVAKVGWAKPVPVDMRYFKHPRQGMALTALAGPAANFLTALAAVGVSSAVFHLAPRRRQAPVLPDGPCPTGLLHPHRNASGRVAAVPGRVCYFKSVLR